MLFTRDMADAFGDWLERERIHRALVSARPQLGDSLVLDEERPLLRILRPRAADVLVAKTSEEPAAGWIVGIPDPQSPTLHEPDSLEELVERVLDAVGGDEARSECGARRPV